MQSVQELLREAKHYGLKIAIENVPEPFPFLLRRVEDFRRFYEDLGEDGLEMGLTFDVGRAYINGQLDDMMYFFREKIVHIHLYDNNGDADPHLGIGLGKIDWPSLIRGLRNIGYKRALVIESKNNVEESIEALKRLIEK